MTHLPWYPAFPSNRHHAGNDIELLQTDVMRFMAILGLSLMAIFALVQGIHPEVRTLPKAATYESASLVAQRAKASAEHSEVRLRELRRALARAEQTALVAKSEAAAAERARAQALAAMARTQEALQSHQLREAERRRTLSERMVSVARLRREAENERQQAKLASASPVVERPQPSAPKRAAPKPSGEGFSLRFASDAALRALVSTGAVGFYGLADRVAWRLNAHQGGLRYQSVPLPRAYHEMQAVTVPTGFVQALNESVPRGVPGTVVWGVTLSGKIAHSIHRLMQRHRNGLLIIERNGRVRREGANA